MNTMPSQMLWTLAASKVYNSNHQVRRPLWTYTILTYAITWTIVWVLYFLYRRSAISLSELNTYYALGSVGPFVSAIVCSQMFYGKKGLNDLFRTLQLKRIERRSLLLSLSPLLFFMVGYFLYPLFLHKWFSFATTKEQFNLRDQASYLGWALPIVTYAVLEEFGWRGFALPHLQERFTAYQSSAILSVIWAAWHFPFFLFRFPFSIGSVIGFLFAIFVGTVILTAIFNLSHGSVLACIIFHLSNNIASAFDKQYLVVMVSIGFVALAIYLVKTYKPQNLSDKERVRNYFGKMQR